MNKINLLNNLEKKYSNCKLCEELSNNRLNVVFGGGNPDKCKIVIIGEAPGANEDKNKIPFVGRSGKLLDGLLEEIGITREEAYITNTILCKPPKNRDPKKDELKNCRERLNQQIKILNPKVVVTLGNFSTKYLLETKEGITKLRGKIFEKDGMKIIPCLHPAVLLYNGNSPKKRKEFQDDFNIIKKALKN